MGEVKVPADKYWGAQTQRSFENFKIGTETMPEEIIRAFGYLKLACAKVNRRLGKLSARQEAAIEQACIDLLEGRLDGNFPLVVWQTGSGTQSNMNVNEVLANRANEILTGGAGSADKGVQTDATENRSQSENALNFNDPEAETPLHPNDHINMSQSSNDTFPSAMHIAAKLAIETRLLPAVDDLVDTFRRLEEENADIIKIGRTHLQDATPLRLSQEISGWRAMLTENYAMLLNALGPLSKLAIGGTAVGTGLNAPEGFGDAVAASLTELTGTSFASDPNKFHALTSKDALVFAHGAVKALAANMMKIANDVRWLASGPRCGIGEIMIPENEPGSSIMPGKVNPTQCEAVTMAAVQVMGNDVAVGMAASQGNFELNVFMPVCIYNFLQSVRLMADSINSFNKNCASGIKANKERIEGNLKSSLMLVTALNPIIGYENAAKIAKYAHKEGITLKEAAVALGMLSAEQYDELVDPQKMV